MKLYNTLTKKEEEFIPKNKNNVTMYTCGPTVYHYAHLGNMRNYIMQDVLEKTLNFLGYKVKRCMNITDVGHLTSDSDTGADKMVQGAKREHTTVQSVAQKYTKSFFQDFEQLNNKKPEIIIPATTCIDKYITMIEVLLKKGYAYQSGGNVYFDITKLNDYYILTNHKIDEMVVGVRKGVEEDTGKKNQSDFALWFTKSKFNEQELKWNSPFGTGYPGWHIECSAIAITYLGEYLDIHCGGIDNIFPHHTNEIAQSESYLGHPWCKYWFHTEHLNDKTGKMSKSKGNFLTLDTIKEKGYKPVYFRYFCLTSHYRNQQVFDYTILDNAKEAYIKLKQKISNIQAQGEVNNTISAKYINEFKKALENDLNTSSALTIIYNLLKETTTGNTKLSLIQKFDQVLSLDLLKKDLINPELEKYIKEKIKERTLAKKNNNYEKADQIRQELTNKHIILKDTKEGTIYEIKS